MLYSPFRASMSIISKRIAEQFWSGSPWLQCLEVVRTESTKWDAEFALAEAMKAETDVLYVGV